MGGCGLLAQLRVRPLAPTIRNTTDGLLTNEWFIPLVWLIAIAWMVKGRGASLDTKRDKKL